MKRILIIDGEREIGQSYAVLFLEEKLEIKQASSAREATNLLIREHFDLVLLDIDIPEASGKLMYEIIREYDRDMKVIVSSVCSVEDQVQSILGACAYHNKSLGVNMLIAKVKEVLSEN